MLVWILYVHHASPTPSSSTLSAIIGGHTTTVSACNEKLFQPSKLYQFARSVHIFAYKDDGGLQGYRSLLLFFYYCAPCVYAAQNSNM